MAHIYNGNVTMSQLLTIRLELVVKLVSCSESSST